MEVTLKVPCLLRHLDGRRVSILVLMEVTLKVPEVPEPSPLEDVSILVLMEVTLKEHFLVIRVKLFLVSILVLMEVTLKGPSISFNSSHVESFNPCFNGSDSKRVCEGFRLSGGFWFQSLF